ncbi:NADH dehydrogenase alpha subcomplex subunit 2 [Punctularia strigosozonata HHB-11173 SS5]|uniref:NADH dehydrogenase alpha subcomplex subunit 2 n=1 Tax=Punctularia strigosozonata (strain HHB-11173) TaxID=741275 RepID=UPI0004416613|nr:NADH dehydrogenase alpha subcomplex subunit 2 [Punctularia strigosozonata HHB-11173 SS5]EIN05452.1 NADH dehydrogenase alpha subcomplex subunit 2 [Punctularia strigosozonata HHB-11173 SS5]
MSAFARALSPAIRELRILCSQSGPGSEGTRQFIQSAYPAIKKANPDLPVLIREASGTPARFFARFEKGVEKHVELDGLSPSDVEARVAQLLKTSA